MNATIASLDQGPWPAELKDVLVQSTRLSCEISMYASIADTVFQRVSPHHTQARSSNTPHITSVYRGRSLDVVYKPDLKHFTERRTSMNIPSVVSRRNDFLSCGLSEGPKDTQKVPDSRLDVRATISRILSRYVAQNRRV